MNIQNKVIVVTGASQGIGKAIAENLNGKGAKIVVTARSIEPLNELVKNFSDGLAIQADMRKHADIEKMLQETIKKYGRIDVLINNAGQAVYGPAETVNLDEYRSILELNVVSVLDAMQQVIPIMRKQGGGMILNISSRVSKNYFPNLSAYASTKYALNAISLTARTELAPDNIIVSVFHPRMTATNFGKNALGSRPTAAPDTRHTGQAAPGTDTAEQVAEQVAEQIISEEPERSMGMTPAEENK